MTKGIAATFCFARRWPQVFLDLGRRLPLLCLMLGAISGAIHRDAHAQRTAVRSFLFDLSAELAVDGDALRIERTLRCNLYRNQSLNLGQWVHGPNVVGLRLPSGRGVGIVVPAACDLLDRQQSPDQLPQGFRPVIIETDNLDDLSSFWIHVSQGIGRVVNGSIVVRSLSVRRAGSEARESPPDGFRRMRLTPSDGRSANGLVWSHLYVGWLAARTPLRELPSDEQTRHLLASYPTSSLIEPADFQTFQDWAPSRQVTHVGPALTGRMVDPCSNELRARVLCVGFGSYDSVVPLVRHQGRFALDSSKPGSMVVYRWTPTSPVNASNRTAWVSDFIQDGVIEIAGLAYNVQNRSRLRFIQRPELDVFEIELTSISFYD